MFGHRITLFELFGFKVHIDLSWLLLAILITWSLAVGYFPAVAPGLAPSTYWWMGVVGLIGLAFSIIAHELSHSLVARRFDMPIRGITLFIFGGVAEMSEEPKSAKGEFLMAIAGPIMSIAVAAVFFMVSGAIAYATDPFHPAVLVTGYLALINGLLAVFNMVPAFPLDGGRVLRAALWGWKKDLVWATRMAAASGNLFGFLLIALSIYSLFIGNFIGAIWWFLIGLFVQGAANSALHQQLARTTLSGQRVRQFMRSETVTVDPDLTLDRLAEDYFYRHYFKNFPVVDRGRLIGSVAIDSVKNIPRERWAFQNVRSIMEEVSGENTIGPDQDASKALAQMQRTGLSRLLVTSGDRLVGVLALRDLLNYLSVRLDLASEEGASDQMRRAS